MPLEVDTFGLFIFAAGPIILTIWIYIGADNDA